MKICARNLSQEVTEEDLQKVFGAYGCVDFVKVARDRFRGISKGYAFIEMPGLSEAQRAISALRGKNLKGRPLKISEAGKRFKIRHEGRGRAGGRRSFADKKGGSFRS